MPTEDIKSTLRDFIVLNYMRGASDSGLGDSDSFLEKGIIDSIGVIELISFIQKRFKIRISVPEITPKNFDTLSRLERFIKSKTESD